MKILLISPLPPPIGGIASWTEQYINWAKENRLNVEVVNTSVIGKRAKKLNHRMNIFDEIRRTQSIIKELAIMINKLKPQLIHLNTSCGKFGIIRDLICAQIANKRGLKIVVHYHCDIKDQVNGRISRYLLSKLAKKAAINLVLNSSSKEFLAKEINIEGVLISNFITETFILDKPKSIKEEIKTVSFVGHVQRSKGVLEMVAAAKKMPEITFKLAGPVAYEISKLNRPPNLFMLGTLTKLQVRELLLESDIFLFPSYTEGFAIVMLEAMATGLPIVTTDVGSNADMIELMGGVIVKAGDSDSILKAIESIKSPNIRLRMSKWNLDKVKNEYTVEKVMKTLIYLYKNELKL